MTREEFEGFLLTKDYVYPVQKELLVKDAEGEGLFDEEFSEESPSVEDVVDALYKVCGLHPSTDRIQIKSFFEELGMGWE